MLPKPSQEKLDDFISKINKLPSGCWEYTSNLDGDRYGRVSVPKGDKTYYTLKAHHCALEWLAGIEVTKGMDVCHRCHNPSCVNPDHLFVGTRSDNMAMKKPVKDDRTESVTLSELTTPQLLSQLSQLRAATIKNLLSRKEELLAQKAKIEKELEVIDNSITPEDLILHSSVQECEHRSRCTRHNPNAVYRKSIREDEAPDIIRQIATRPEGVSLWAKCKEIAEQIGVTPLSVSRVWKGTTYRHLDRAAIISSCSQ